MVKPYIFEAFPDDDEGTDAPVKVEFFPGTVRSNMEARRIVQKLLRAYGHFEIPAPDDEYDNMDEYASAMARSQTTAPWWSNSNMPEEKIRAAYELFLDEPESLWAEFRTAARATAIPKKTKEKTPAT